MNMKNERGIALVFGLLLLLVMTVVGVSAMNGSLMQERMAGNARMQSIAFEAATAGVASSIDFVSEELPEGMPPCGEFDFTEWQVNWTDANGKPLPTPWIPLTGTGDRPDSGDNVVIERRAYCLWDHDGGITSSPRSHLYIESRGRVLDGDNNAIASRNIEVRLKSGRPSGGDDICAAQMACEYACDSDGNCQSNSVTLGDFIPAQSGSYKMDGNGGHAMCVCNQDMLDAITTAIESSGNGTYEGINGSGADAFDVVKNSSPWRSPAEVKQFTDMLKTIAQASGTYHSGGYTSNNAQFGTEDDPQITYVDGAFDSGGNPSGNGILVVNGSVEWNGNGDFNGLVIVLGDSFSVKGGGNGGISGSVVFAPMNEDSSSFGEIDVSFHNDKNKKGGGAGGGNALYAHSCENLTNAEEELGQYYYNPVNGDVFSADSLPPSDPSDPGYVDPDSLIKATDIWKAQCNGGPDDIFEEGPEWLMLVSWRENLGWREEDDFFSASTLTLP